MTQDLTRAMLYSPKLEEWTLELNRQLTYTPEMPLTIRDYPLKKLVVGADDELVAIKVYDSVIRGAEENPIWSQIARVVYMTSEIERAPLFTPDDILFKKWARGSKPESSGGSFWMVELNCEDDKGLYGIDVGLSKDWVKARGFDAVEEVLWGVGQSANRLILQSIVTKLLADVSTSSPDMTDTLANWGASHYKAFVKMESLLAKIGMMGTVGLVNPDEGYDMAIEDYFIDGDYAAAARGIAKDIHVIGHLYGTIPIYRHRDCTAASMILAAGQKACAVGLRKDLTIEGYDDVREGMMGSICSLQFDVKDGSDAKGPSGATNPVKGAWAVTTSA